MVTYLVPLIQVPPRGLWGLRPADEEALTGEGARLLAFAAGPASDHDIRLTDPGTGTTPATL